MKSNIVYIYTINNCPYCKELKNLLATNNIKFEEINTDIEENKNLFNNLVKISQSTNVPQIIINKKIFIPDISFKSYQECLDLIKSSLI